MLFTTIEEIRAYMPTSKWAAADMPMLQTLLGEEEEFLAQHHLGYALHEELCSRYEELSKDGPITAISAPDITVKILRDCQRVILFSMLDHNSGIFAVSFNKGGGINSMTAQDYEAANKDQTEQFNKSAYHKTRRNIESLLMHLEQDAKGDKVFTELWKESGYFYLNKDLLFTTAFELQQFLNIEQSRDRYIQLVPAIRRCQQSYVISRVGREYFDFLLAAKRGEKEMTHTDIDVLQLLSIGLASYIEADERIHRNADVKYAAELGSRDKSARDLRSEGLSHIQQAVKLLCASADDYDKLFSDKANPLAYAYSEFLGTEYIPLSERTQETPEDDTESTAVVPKNNKVKHSYDRHNNRNAVFSLGCMHHKI